MEKESFENEQTARIMNEHFVNIKLDREERPDIDKIYMNFLLMIKGSGGWPMSVWLTPDLAPITAATCFPESDRWGMPGFRTVLMKISNQWKDNKDTLGSTGKNIIEAMQNSVLEKATSDSPDGMSVEGKFNQAVNIYKSVDEVKKVLAKGNEILQIVLEKRPRPHLDTKILTACNGLVLSGLSKLACIKDAPNRLEYLRIVKQQVESLKKNNYDEKWKTLLRSCYGEGTDSDVTTVLAEPISGFLDDYAFLIKGLLDYYLATIDYSALFWARELQTTQDKLFWDTKNHGRCKADAANVIVRLKDDHDGAEPCGNSVAAANLLLLSEYFDDDSYRTTAAKLFEFFSASNPFGYALPEMMSALLVFDSGLTTITVVGPESVETMQLLDTARDFYAPGLVVIHRIPGTDQQLTKSSASAYQIVDDKATAYLCHNGVCEPPITSIEKLAESLSTKYLFK